MERKNSKPRVIRYILISIIVFFSAIGVSLVTNYFFITAGLTGTQANHIAGLIEGIIAAIATGLVLYQLKAGEAEKEHRTNIEEATFVLQANLSFIENKDLMYVQNLLQQRYLLHADKKFKGKMITDDNIQLFVNYLVYLEGLAPLILQDILRLENVDNLMGFRYFLAVNNPEVQEECLCKFPEYYGGIFRVYTKWKQFELDQGKKILMDDCSLDKWSEFQKYAI